MTKPINVIHYNPIWLEQTQTWLYSQIYYLPESITNYIVCEKTKNLDQFNLPNINNLFLSYPLLYRLDKILKKLKLSHSSSAFIKISKACDGKILHSHFGQNGWFNLSNAKKANLKHIVTFYGYDVNCLPQIDRRWLTRYHDLFEQIDLVLCEGPHMGECIVKLGCPPEKVVVHHLGVKVNEIAYQPRVWKKDEPLGILMAASFVEKKGFTYGLEALGIIQNEIPLEITIIGDAQKGSKLRQNHSQIEKEKILATIAKHQLKVRLLGYQPYSVFFEEAYKHHIFLSPSVTASDGDTEGGAPVSLIEMAATGMPIVSTTHCDIPEVVKPGITGLLAPEKDVEGLVNHLRWYINHAAEWGSLLDAGRKHIETNYDAKLQGQKLAAIYQDIAKSSP